MSAGAQLEQGTLLAAVVAALRQSDEWIKQAVIDGARAPSAATLFRNQAVLARVDTQPAVAQPELPMTFPHERELRLRELLAAASAGTAEPQERAVSPGLWFGPHRAERLRNALAYFGIAPADAPAVKEPA